MSNPFNIIGQDQPQLKGKVFSNDTQAKSANERIEAMIKSCPVFLFMKGTPDFPQCGFSANVISILETTGIEYETFDVLSDMEIRQGIKDFSNWPTIPQLYLKGEFVGGCDIVTEMYQSGELQKLLE